jgi:hypothetical protein
MTEATARAPMFKMLLLFLGTLVAANLALMAFNYFLPDFELPTSMGIIFLMAASMAAGQVGGQSVRRRLTLGEKATFAVAATVLAAVLTFAVLWGMFAWYEVPFTVEMVTLAMTGESASQSDIDEVLPLAGLFVAGVSLLVTFFAVGWGARTQVKALERQAAKAK